MSVKLQVSTNSTRDSVEASRMRSGSTWQKATEVGAMSQWKMDSGCVVDVMRFDILGKVLGRLDRGTTRSG